MDTFNNNNIYDLIEDINILTSNIINYYNLENYNLEELCDLNTPLLIYSNLCNINYNYNKLEKLIIYLIKKFLNDKEIKNEIILLNKEFENEELAEDLAEELNEELIKEFNQKLNEELNEDLAEDLAEELNEDLNEELNKDLKNKYLNKELTEELKNEELNEELIKEFNQKNINYFTYNDLENRMNKLLNINLPVQRTKEWYKMRHNMITASDLYKVLKSDSSRKELLIRKSSSYNLNFNKLSSSKACNHGIKYEQIAILLYEKRNNVKILDFGCIPHFNSSIPFGASPDGIVELNGSEFSGRMLEIKCPYSRIINGKIPDMYWKQIQGQLEVCDLFYCDYLECKIEEYTNKDEYLNDGIGNKTKNNLEKGAILLYLDIDINEYKYIYMPIDLTIEKLEIMIEEEINKILENNNKNFIKIIWWKLITYSCVLVKRDKEWFKTILPNIIEFWKKVEYYRENGNESLITKNKKKNIQKNITINIDLNKNTNYFLDSDTD